MKKAVTVFAALLLALSLVGCGTQKSAATDPKGNGTTVTTPDSGTQTPTTTVPDTHTPDTDKPDITDVPEAVGDGLEELGEDLGLTDDGEAHDRTEDGNVGNGPFDSGEYTDNDVTNSEDN